MVSLLLGLIPQAIIAEVVDISDFSHSLPTRSSFIAPLSSRSTSHTLSKLSSQRAPGYQWSATSANRWRPRPRPHCKGDSLRPYERSKVSFIHADSTTSLSAGGASSGAIYDAEEPAAHTTATGTTTASESAPASARGATEGASVVRRANLSTAEKAELQALNAKLKSE